MKITNRDEIGKSNAGPLIAYEFELDSKIQIQAEQIKLIVNTIISSDLYIPYISMICISFDDCNLHFDTVEELFDYINNIDGATHYIQETMRGLQVLGFGFELWTNRMNISLRLHEESEVLQLVERIEAALLGDDGHAEEAASVVKVPPMTAPTAAESSLKVCPLCGKQNSEDHLFCFHCGADLRTPLCRFCNKELPENSNFCPWCGKAQAEPELPTHPRSDP